MSKHHHPPDLLQLMIDAIPRLCRSKRDVVLFFRGAGVADSEVADIEARLASDPDSLNKFEIARTVLVRLNDIGDKALRERRKF